MMWKSLVAIKHRWVLLAILFLAGSFRLVGLNWDQGGHMHPDERAIIMAVETLHWPDSLNPKFFAYGNLPFYLLRLVGSFAGHFESSLGNYQQINLVGRFISAMFELGTVVVIYLLGRRIESDKLGLWSAFLYSVAVLPIQLAHFYAVDTLLTFFIATSLFLLTCFVKTTKRRYLIYFGLFWGMALATKASAAMLAIPFLVALAGKYYKSIPKLILWGGLSVVVAAATFTLNEPFAILDYQTFRTQLQQQEAMTRDAWVFPYTLQYVNKIPYWHEFKNIYLWGLGPVLATLSLAGIGILGFVCVRKKQLAMLVVLTFAAFYFGVVGKFAIGFIRYMLPIYPILCLGGGIVISRLSWHTKIGKLVLTGLLGGLAIWPLSFMTIYTQPNARTAASQWIYANIPEGSTIAREHWDDGLPGGGPNIYNYLELPMYDPDTPEKWEKINSVLAESDYLIIASNRLYVPLMKLTDCQRLPEGRCFAQTASYYRALFDGSLGYTKTAEFWVLPQVPFTNWVINDFSADENFTVFDHPRILIYKNDKDT